jgi:hypothetical protein
MYLFVDTRWYPFVLIYTCWYSFAFTNVKISPIHWCKPIRVLFWYLPSLKNEYQNMVFVRAYRSSQLVDVRLSRLVEGGGGGKEIGPARLVGHPCSSMSGRPGSSMSGRPGSSTSGCPGSSGGGGGKMLKVNARVTLDSSFRLAVSSFTSRPGVNFINIMCTHVFVQVSLLTTFFHFRCLIGKGFAGGLVFELKSSLNILVREEITKQIKLIQPFFVKKVSISSRGKLFMV